MNDHNKWHNLCATNTKVSETSLAVLAKRYIGESLSAAVARQLSIEVSNEVKDIVKDAVKYARRTRASKMKMRHMEHALLQHDVNLCLLLQFGEDGCVASAPSDRQADVEQSTPAQPPKEQKLEPHRELTSPPPTEPAAADGDAVNCGWLKHEEVQLKPSQKYPLSKEQQNFYELITEACVGSSELKRRSALQTLGTDPALQSVLPSLALFIAEAVEVNVVQQNMALLLYLMRMVRALLANGSLSLYKYLHLFIPSVLTCVLSRQPCAYPTRDNHWALREYAGNIIAEIVRHFHTTDNRILPRVIGIYNTALLKAPLATVYGAVIGLGKMGNHVVRAFVIPQIRYISALIESHLQIGQRSCSSDRQAAKYIRHRMLKICAPVLRNLHSPSDAVLVYAEEYGYLGPSLCDAVVVARIKAQVTAEAKAAQQTAAAVIKDKTKTEASTDAKQMPIAITEESTMPPPTTCTTNLPSNSRQPLIQPVAMATLNTLQSVSVISSQLRQQHVMTKPVESIGLQQQKLQDPQLRPARMVSAAARLPINKASYVGAGLGCNGGNGIKPLNYLVTIRKSD